MSEKRAVLGHGKFATDICEVFGIDPARTHAIHLHIVVGEVVALEIHQRVRSAESGKLLDVIRNYQLVNAGIEIERDVTAFSDRSKVFEIGPQ